MCSGCSHSASLYIQGLTASPAPPLPPGQFPAGGPLVLHQLGTSMTTERCKASFLMLTYISPSFTGKSHHLV